jgi:SAM-dependent methyltransferase
MSEILRTRPELFACPACGGDLGPEPACEACGRRFGARDGLLDLHAPHEDEASDVTHRIQAFYERHPFPNYDRMDDVASLMARARRNPFARLLDEHIPFGTTILECGCGTGQWTNFLALAERTVIGTDLCENSLRLGLGFRRAHDLHRAHFLRMNLFRPCFRPGRFDLVICNGVLHHTSHPRRGFEGLATLVRPGGYFVVGLYHRHGRRLHDLRALLLRLGGPALHGLDPRIRELGAEEIRKNTWYMDQYRNPHESRHTLAEVALWMAASGFEVLRTLPSSRLFGSWEPTEGLFSSEGPVSATERALADLSLALLGTREGGFFVVIGRKTLPEGVASG